MTQKQHPVPSSMTGPILNIAGYRFVDLPDRDELRAPLIEVCRAGGLRGTILLAHEGINFFIAGTQEGIDLFLGHIEKDLRFLDIPLKTSHTAYQPFNRMNVRLKNEIISMGMGDVKPAEFTGEAIEPTEFKRWLDEGKAVTVLDTRNDYEIRLGTFTNALELDIGSFRSFPAAISELPDDLKDTPVVMFCTGGIRCEKASVVMLEAGFKDVRQLKGGILGYFAQVGGAHWEGDCFVFDHRVAVTPELNESDAKQCFACREPLTLEDQQSPSYVVEVSCPYCIPLR